MAVPAQMSSDWANYWANGSGTMSWAGGTLTRQSDGSAIYVDPTGKAMQFNQGTDLNSIAQASPYIAQQWNGQYGFEPTVQAAWGGTTVQGPTILQNYTPPASTTSATTGATTGASTGSTSVPIPVPGIGTVTTGTGGTTIGTTGSSGTSTSTGTGTGTGGIGGAVFGGTPTGTTGSTGTSGTSGTTGSTTPPVETNTSQLPNEKGLNFEISTSGTYTNNNPSLYANGVGIPGVTQVAQPGLINAATAAPAPAVSAGTGTAAQANGTTASNTSPVTAGTVTGSNTTAAGYSATDAQAGGMSNGPSTYTAEQGAATNWNVTPDQAVQSQIRDIIAENSPLMQQAEARALAKANSRGLLNSNLAVQSGQSALYDAAMPIAQQDAATRASAAQFNANAANTMTQANLAAKNQASQFNAASANEYDLKGAELKTSVNLANAQARNQAAQFGAAAQNEANQFNAQVATQVSQANVENALKAGIVNQEQANAISKFNAELLTNVNLANVKSQNDLQQFLLDQQLKAGIVNQQQANAIAQFNAEQANKVALADLANDTDVAKFNASESNAMAKLGMDESTKFSLAQLEANYKSLLQASSSAASLYQQYLGNIAQVLQNSDMGADAKQAAIKSLMTQLNNGMNIVGQIANLNLPQLTFTDQSTGTSGATTSTGTSTGTNGNGLINQEAGGA